VSVPPFALFFHPADSLTFFNYAIPEEAIVAGVSSDLSGPLAEMRDVFASRGRQPRVEFIEEFVPDLVPALRKAGFVEEERQQGMICLPDTLEPAPDVLGLTITRLTGESPVSEVQDLVTVQRRAFNLANTQPATESEAQRLIADLHEGMAFLARLDGQPVGAGMYTAPFDGLTEVTGLATLGPFRRGGIATALTAVAVQTAFGQAVEAVYLTAADERAGRVFERIGFRGFVTMLAYVGPQ
jgi:GNAT superfamily N-acetyltransferase